METIRLTKSEQEQIDLKTMEINKLRVNNGIDPITKSDLVHMLIGASLVKLKATKEGEVLIK